MIRIKWLNSVLNTLLLLVPTIQATGTLLSFTNNGYSSFYYAVKSSSLQFANFTSTFAGSVALIGNIILAIGVVWAFSLIKTQSLGNVVKSLTSSSGKGRSKKKPKPKKQKKPHSSSNSKTYLVVYDEPEYQEYNDIEDYSETKRRPVVIKKVRLSKRSLDVNPYQESVQSSFQSKRYANRPRSAKIRGPYSILSNIWESLTNFAQPLRRASRTYRRLFGIYEDYWIGRRVSRPKARPKVDTFDESQVQYVDQEQNVDQQPCRPNEDDAACDLPQ